MRAANPPSDHRRRRGRRSADGVLLVRFRGVYRTRDERVMIAKVCNGEQGKLVTMTATDPREIIDRSAMTAAQLFVVIITVLLNGMDGFDILSIAFASNGIAAEWHIA